MSPVSTRSSYSATDLLSPVSGRSNVTVTVADVHHYDEMQEGNSEIKIDRREIPDTTIYTVRTFQFYKAKLYSFRFRFMK